jgi:hypothetical protein
LSIILPLVTQDILLVSLILSFDTTKEWSFFINLVHILLNWN